MSNQTKSMRAVRTILAINFNHDGAGVILVDGKITAFTNTERFSRKKKHPGIRTDELNELLRQAGLAINDIDHVLLCNLNNMDTPDVFNKHGTHLKETWLPFWINQTYDRVMIQGVEIPCTLNPDHHLLHAACAYYTSPFTAGIAVAIDPLGCRAFVGKNNKLYPIRRDFDANFQANVGYCYVSDKLFGSSVFDAGKVMGLAPYGRPLNEPDFNYAQINTLEKLYALAEKDPIYIVEGKTRLNATLAYYIQMGLEIQLTSVLHELYEIARRNGIAPNLCLSGGTALNSVANQLAFAQSQFEQLHLHPACGDDGTAIGAALWYWYDHLGNERQTFSNPELMYSIKSYDDSVDAVIAHYRDRVVVEKTADYISKTADLISDGHIIGWFQGPSEIGPRALGNRSILADPRHPEMKNILNARVKFREGFRPFAPSVLNEHAEAWFGLKDSPFMLRVTNVLKEGAPAITHVDKTARIQTVSRPDNPHYYDLIDAFYQKTGVPMLVNTSFNIKGDPIIETPDDALACFLGSGIDYLIFPGTIVSKR